MSLILTGLICFLAGYGAAGVVDKIRKRNRKFYQNNQVAQRNEEEAVIVKNNDRGEPQVRQVLVKKSPVPGWLAGILIFLAAGTIISTVVQNQRDNDTRNKVKIAQCQNFAQLKFRADETRASYVVLAEAIRKLTDPKAQQSQVVDTLNQLADYYEAAGKDPGGLPPLPPQALRDCRDGVFNDGYSFNIGGEAPPASPVPQSSVGG